MKRATLVSLVCVVLSILVLVTGCGSNSTGSTSSSDPKATGTKSSDTAFYKDGTYEGSSDKGIHPGLKVSVTVKGGKITEVKVTENSETEGVGSRAIEELPGKIVTAQSTDVEATSGASLSSAAIKEAVEKALAQAK